MARNIEKEYDWSKQKYEAIFARIEKQLGLELKQKLKDEGKSTAEWITENAKKYLKKS